ncbi:MAG TPA: thiamine-phosphate kinase [Vicinamibacterales bacterium]|nr:thiamine-phosphate kinase [Vicinamibacterales bacterium]
MPNDTGGWRTPGSAALVGDLSESALIDRVRQRLPPAPDWLIVGIGDDAAVVEPERNRVEVLSVDAIVEGVHFDRAFVPPDAVGYRALAVNLSDLAAMGASPRLALLSLALPSHLALADFDGMVGGLCRLAAEHRVQVVGGNLTRSPGPLMIDVTVVGTVKRRQALKRAGARPGDEIFVSGTIGSAAAGMGMLREKVSSGETCVERYLYPAPRVRLGLQLARNRAASSAIDLSDGLADGVHRLAEASGVGAILESEALPIEPAARAWFAGRGLDPVSEALTAGDDYELLFTVRPRTARRLQASKRHGAVSLTRIGRCTEAGPVLLMTGGVHCELPRRGYVHFGSPARAGSETGGRPE